MVNPAVPGLSIPVAAGPLTSRAKQGGKIQKQDAGELSTTMTFWIARRKFPVAINGKILRQKLFVQ